MALEPHLPIKLVGRENALNYTVQIIIQNEVLNLNTIQHDCRSFPSGVETLNRSKALL